MIEKELCLGILDEQTLAIARILKITASDLWQKHECHNEEFIERTEKHLNDYGESGLKDPAEKLFFEDLMILRMCKHVTSQICDTLSRRKRILGLEIKTVELPGRPVLKVIMGGKRP